MSLTPTVGSDAPRASASDAVRDEIRNRSDRLEFFSASGDFTNSIARTRLDCHTA
jgi:hypothetical protein